MMYVKEPNLNGAKMRFIGNLIQKIISFALNQLLIQYTSPEVLGIAAIQLELLLATILFLSREGIRMSVLRNNIATKCDFYRTINLSWIPSTIISVSLVCFSVYHTYCNLPLAEPSTVLSESSFSSTSTSSLSTITMVLYGTGALFESFGEPCLNIYQYNLSFVPRISAEVIAVFMRSVVTFIAVAVFDMGVVGFGVAQLFYGITYLFTLIYYSCKMPVTMTFVSDVPRVNNNNENSSNNVKNTMSDEKVEHLMIITSLQLVDFLPRFITTSNSDTDLSSSSLPSSSYQKNKSLIHSFIEHFISIDLLLCALFLTASSLFKHILTEADRIVLSLFFTPYDQGIFAFANNYGSLIARLVFLPLEESCRLTFSNTVNVIKTEYHALYNLRKSVANDDDVNNGKISDKNNSTTTTTTTTSSSGSGSVKTIQKVVLSKYLPQLHSVILLLQLLALFGLFLLIFGPFYVRFLFTIIPFHAKWRTNEVIQTLAYYCLYLFVLGFNGVSEAFVHSVCPTNYFYMINFSYFISSLVYVCFITTAHYVLKGSDGGVISDIMTTLTNGVYHIYMYILSFAVLEYLPSSVLSFLSPNITTRSVVDTTATNINTESFSAYNSSGSSTIMMGASTLVLASAVSMSVRIIFNMWFIQRFFHQPMAFLFPPALCNITDRSSIQQQQQQQQQELLFEGSIDESHNRNKSSSISKSGIKPVALSSSSFYPTTTTTEPTVTATAIIGDVYENEQQKQDPQYYEHSLHAFIPSLSFLLILVSIVGGLHYSSSQYYHHLFNLSQRYDMSINEITVMSLYKLAIQNTTVIICNGLNHTNESCRNTNSSNSNRISGKCNNLFLIFYPLIQHLCVGLFFLIVFCIACYLHTPISMRREIYKLLRPNMNSDSHASSSSSSSFMDHEDNAVKKKNE